jgi:hypothetical protein
MLCLSPDPSLGSPRLDVREFLSPPACCRCGGRAGGLTAYLSSPAAARAVVYCVLLDRAASQLRQELASARYMQTLYSGAPAGEAAPLKQAVAGLKMVHVNDELRGAPFTKHVAATPSVHEGVPPPIASGSGGDAAAEMRALLGIGPEAS